MKKKNRLSAAEWFYSRSFHSNAYDEPPASTTASTPTLGDKTVVERWDGSQWVSDTLTWNGERYVK